MFESFGAFEVATGTMPEAFLLVPAGGRFEGLSRGRGAGECLTLSGMTQWGFCTWWKGGGEICSAGGCRARTILSQRSLDNRECR